MIDIGKVTDTDVTEELSSSFLEYALSVIVSRALPDVRDGLKPVHRRILYAMRDASYRPDRPYTKCARVVGRVLGELHPHGDAAAYEALVRLAQDWSMRLPLIDGHGNFGNLDDGPAAARYTECRLSWAGAAMLDELDEDTVDFVPNYDARAVEPTVLPVPYPNLLVNGATGIAVGMATNIAPHNLAETIAAVIHLARHPEATVEDLMAHLPGPDFPTGGILLAGEDVADAYRTGRGSFRVRARARIEDVSARRRGIVVTELPWGVGPEKIIAKIKDLVSAKRLGGIADVKDLSDRRNGLRMVIEIKSGFDPAGVLEQLWRLTPLEETYSAHHLALVDGQPRTLTLVELCRHFLEFRRDVVRRRSAHRLARAGERAHLVAGLVAALADIDEVVRILRTSRQVDTARTKLMRRLGIDRTQCDHILEMPLRRITALEAKKLKTELAELRATIAELEALLASEDRITDLVVAELEATAARFATARRTELVADAGPEVAAGAGAPAVELADDPCRVLVGTSGTLWRSAPAGGGGRRRGRTPPLAAVIDTTQLGRLGVVCASGRWETIAVCELALGPAPIREYLDVRDDPVVAVLNAARLADTPLALFTARGVVKRLAPGEARAGRSIIALREGDAVVGAAAAPDGADLVMISDQAQLLRFAAATVRTQGRTGGGVVGMRTAGRVISAGVIDAQAADGPGQPVVVTVADGPSVKTSWAGDFPRKGRGGAGVRCHHLRRGETRLIAAAVGTGVRIRAGREIDPPPAARRDATGTPLERFDALVASG